MSRRYRVELPKAEAMRLAGIGTHYPARAEEPGTSPPPALPGGGAGRPSGMRQDSTDAT